MKSPQRSRRRNDEVFIVRNWRETSHFLLKISETNLLKRIQYNVKNTWILSRGRKLSQSIHAARYGRVSIMRFLSSNIPAKYGGKWGRRITMKRIIISLSKCSLLLSFVNFQKCSMFNIGLIKTGILSNKTVHVSQASSARQKLARTDEYWIFCLLLRVLSLHHSAWFMLLLVRERHTNPFLLSPTT